MPATTTTTHQLTVPGVGDVQISVDQRGEGRAFVALHGGAGPRSMYRFAARLAAAEHTRVLTPTHPGFDGAPRPDHLKSVRGLASVYVALLEELGLSDVTVVGNSIGGWIASEMALLGSARIARVVLVDATGIDVPGHPVTDLSSLSRDEVMQLSFHDPDSVRTDPTPPSPAAQALAAGNSDTLALYGGASSSDPELRQRLATLDVAVLVVWGDRDRIVDPDYGRAYAGAIPGARFCLLSACGHVPQIEAPEQLLAAIGDFTASHPAWTHQHTLDTGVARHDVWAALTDLYTGTIPSDGGDTIELHGPFAVGTALSVTPPGSDTVIECTIIELVDGEVFAYQSPFDGLMITSRHALTRLGDGGTRIVHDSVIAGPRAETRGPQIGPRITADHPTAMDDLVAAATERGHRRE